VKRASKAAKLQAAEQGVRDYYAELRARWGAQHWWPAQSRFEVIVGAFLTQNTSWTNVEKAMRKLRSAGKLSLAGVRKTPEAELADLIRSSGYYKQKAHRLKRFVAWLDETYGGSLDRMFARPTELLRRELLALHGVGPETADSILLYAGGHAVFVVDAYTRRIFERHRLAKPAASYDEVRQTVERALSTFEPGDIDAADPMHPPSRMSRAPRAGLAQHFNELHGLIVRTGKEYCGTRATCAGCPLEKYLPVTSRPK
jgi:endonuclease-3 related protein